MVCMSMVNGSNYSGASGRKNVGLLSGSSGGVAGVAVAADFGAAASAGVASVVAASVATSYSSAGVVRALLLYCHCC